AGAQPAEVLRAIGGLHLAEQPLELIEVGARQANRVAAGGRRSRCRTAATTEPAEAHRPRAAGRRVTQRGPASQCGLGPGLPPRPDKIAHDGDKAELEEQAEERGQAAKAASKPVAEQQADQACAQEARGQSAKEAGPVEQAARLSRRRRGALSYIGVRLRRLGHAALERTPRRQGGT